MANRNSAEKHSDTENSANAKALARGCCRTSTSAVMIQMPCAYAEPTRRRALKKSCFAGALADVAVTGIFECDSTAKHAPDLETLRSTQEIQLPAKHNGGMLQIRCRSGCAFLP